MSSVAAIPAAAGETEESEIDSQVQTNNEIAVEDSETSNADSEEIIIDNADSNEANDPEESVESSADPTEEETAGGESSTDDVSDDAAVEEDQSEVQEVEQEIVDRVFSLGDRSINTIMTHRNDIVSIDIDMSNAQIFEIVSEHLYQVYPVTRNRTLDEIVGTVYLKDLFGKTQDPLFNLRDMIRPAQYFHENMDVYKVLEQLRTNHIKYGLICNEFGSLQGIVPIKDLLEALVGSLPSETEDPEIVHHENNSWLIDGQCSFYDFLTHFDREDLYAENTYNTVSGLILEQLEHIPHTGESLTWNNFELKVIDMDGARIDKVLVTYHQEAE